MTEEPETKTISEMLPQLNNSLYIPCLQRDYCWSQKQIEMLWDSLLRGLPLGSLLIWEDTDDDARTDPAYSFIRQYVNERGYPADDGPTRYSQRLDFENLPDNYSLVLDGQQRLTSFYLSLTGSFTTRTYRGWKSKPESWNQRQLHFDLLSGEQGDEHDRGLVYEFDFRKQDGLSESGGSYWFPVEQLVSCSDDLVSDSFIDKDTLLGETFSEIQSKVPEDKAKRAKENLERLWWGVNQREAILYETTDTNEKTARELFIRRNKAGEELSGVDILLALLTGYWKTVDDDGTPTDAKKEIEQFTEKLSGNETLSDQGFTFGKHFVLRTLLLLSGESPSFRKDGRYDGDNLRYAETIFHDPEFEDAIEDAFKISSELGFHKGALSSKTVVLPVIQYLYLNDTAIEEVDTEPIHYWLATTVLNTVFGNVGSQRVLETAREHVELAETERFPAEDILEELSGNGAVTRLDRETLDDLLEEIDYRSGSRRNVLLTHLYDDRRSGHREYEVDHIFPRGKLGEEEFLHEQGVELDRVDWFKENRDHIANLQLLSGGTGGENPSKSDRNLTEWLERIDAGEVDSVSNRTEYFDEHLVPADEDLHEYPKFPQFLTGPNGRLQLIKEQLRESLPLKKPEKVTTSPIG